MKAERNFEIAVRTPCLRECGATLRIRREKERKTKRISTCLFSKDCSGVMKMSWREN